MSAYTDQINSHQFHDKLSYVKTEIEAISSLEDIPVSDKEVIARISYVIRNTEESEESCDKNLISTPWLDDASNAFNNIAGYLSSFRTSRDSNYLTNALGQLDILLNVATRLNCVKSAPAIKRLTNSMSAYTSVMDTHNEQLSQKVETLTSKMVSLENSAQEQIQIAKNSTIDFQNQINTERQRLDALAIAYQQQMAADQQSFLSMLESQREAFSSRQEEKAQTFSSAVEQANVRMKEIEQAALAQAEASNDSSNSLIEATRLKFAEYEKQIEDIIGTANTNMFSYKYKAVADDAHERAKKWHWIAVILMLVVSGFAAYAFVITTNQDTSWVKLVAKIFATTSLITGAAYAARQASKQEKVERYARKIEMELVAIDPFIKSLKEEEQRSIKAEIARRIFGSSDTMELTNKNDAYIGKFATAKQLTQIVELIKDMVQK